MYYNVVESNLRVMKLSSRRIISRRALYNPPRQSVIGYTCLCARVRRGAGIFMHVIFEARCSRDIPGLRVNYSSRIRFSDKRVGLLTLDCDPDPAWMYRARRASNSRSLFKSQSRRHWIIISRVSYRFLLRPSLSGRSIVRYKPTTDIITDIERKG